MRQARERMTGLSGPAFDGARQCFRHAAGLLSARPTSQAGGQEVAVPADMRLSLTFNRQSIYPTGMVGQGAIAWLRQAGRKVGREGGPDQGGGRVIRTSRLPGTETLAA
jgi:hypothetical protein